MTLENAQDIFDQLDDLLEKEHDAMLAGDLDCIARLVDQKETLIGQLTQLEQSDELPVATLQNKLQHNHALLENALQGIRRAASRMAAIRRVRRSLETYDEAGQKRTIDGEVVHQVERRA